MKTRFLLLVPVIIFAGIFSGCTKKAKYERLLKHELASGIRNDSIFMGIYLGMAEKDFYTHCWLLNGKGIIKQGLRNSSVEYQMRKEINYPAIMDFYPVFVKGKIYEMPVRYVYSGWAPWNKSLGSDSLQLNILKWFEKQYGNGFIPVEHPKRGIAYVKIDGNRQISLFKENDTFVWAIFTDMSVKKEVSDTTKNVITNPADSTKDLK
jgi:hypothetical protein